MRREVKYGFKLGIIICAFLYALSEMCAENIHWAIGDLILIALWIGGKDILNNLRIELDADKFFKKMQPEKRRKEVA